MISTTRQVARELNNLPVESFLLVVDEDGNEYVIETIAKQPLHADNSKEWCYALKIKAAGKGCIKR